MNIFKLAPNISDISSEPLILTGVLLMVFGIVIPCLIWFIRNIYRVVLKKDYWWLNKTLKYSWFIGIVIFIVGLIILIVRITS